MNAEDVHLEDLPPVVGIDLPGRPVRAADTGVGDEQVDRAELAFGLDDHLVDGRAVADVHLERHPVNLAGNVLDLRARARRDRDVRAGVR